jgi:hypothetical protein
MNIGLISAELRKVTVMYNRSVHKISLRDIWPDDISFADPDHFSDDEIAHEMGLEMSQYHAWHRAWLYGIVVDKDAPFTELYGYYHPEPEYYSGSYYIPDDYLSEVELTTLDNPPRLLSLAEQEQG